MLIDLKLLCPFLNLSRETKKPFDYEYTNMFSICIIKLYYYFHYKITYLCTEKSIQEGTNFYLIFMKIIILFLFYFIH